MRTLSNAAPTPTARPVRPAAQRSNRTAYRCCAHHLAATFHTRTSRTASSSSGVAPSPLAAGLITRLPRVSCVPFDVTQRAAPLGSQPAAWPRYVVRCLVLLAICPPALVRSPPPVRCDCSPPHRLVRRLASLSSLLCSVRRLVLRVALPCPQQSSAHVQRVVVLSVHRSAHRLPRRPRAAVVQHESAVCHCGCGDSAD